jgi:hypothetical protein
MQNDSLKPQENFPSALESFYSVPKISQPILHKEESLEITQEINQHQILEEGSGKVSFAWFPHPSIQFYFLSTKPDFYVDMGDMILRLTRIGVSVKAHISGIQNIGDGTSQIAGQIQEPVCIGSDRELSYIEFHIVNFHNFTGVGPKSVFTQDSTSSWLERVELEAENWKITLNQLVTTTNKIEQLSHQGGFSVTHVGKLEKLSSESFIGDEAISFLRTFSHFLSFARGFRIPIILLVGYDANKEKVWEYWHTQKADSWQYVGSWFQTSEGKILQEILPGFLAWWKDWRDSAELILDTYLESNLKAGSAAAPVIEKLSLQLSSLIDSEKSTVINSMALHRSLENSEQTASDIKSSIILSQIAFELLSWTYFVSKGNIPVDQDQTYSRRKFKCLSTHEKIRELLKKNKISLTVPPEEPPKPTVRMGTTDMSIFQEPVPEPLEALAQLIVEKNSQVTEKTNENPNCSEENHQWDGCKALVKIRNDFAHVEKKLQVSQAVLIDTARLGLWYQELVLLALCSHKGKYFCRIPKQCQNGELSQVPWSLSDHIDNIETDPLQASE